MVDIPDDAIEATDAEVPIDVGIQKLKEQLEAAKAEKQALALRVREAENNAFNALTDKRDTDILLIDGSIAELERNDTLLVAALAEANAIGDYAKAAELQREMVLTAQRIDKLRDGKDEFERKPIPKPEPVEVRESDPVEELAIQLTPKSADWIRAHPECVTDPNMNRRMVAAHNIADTTPGVKVDSPEYFRIIEQMLYPHKQETTEVADDPISDAGRSAPQAAPVSRGGSARNTITLSKAQREMAADLGMSEKEYGENMMKLREEGRVQ